MQVDRRCDKLIIIIKTIFVANYGTIERKAERTPESQRERV